MEFSVSSWKRWGTTTCFEVVKSQWWNVYILRTLYCFWSFLCKIIYRKGLAISLLIVIDFVFYRIPCCIPISYLRLQTFNHVGKWLKECSICNMWNMPCPTEQSSSMSHASWWVAKQRSEIRRICRLGHPLHLIGPGLDFVSLWRLGVLKSENEVDAVQLIRIS